jgi:glucosamine--fructose-6-phosphate aminotransferase (isomerizing)
MCGIVGYIGHREALPILTSCLKKVEYRGYDSCGIAVLENRIQVFKDVGRIGELEARLPQLNSKIGIGHTRWATHGEPSQKNAHPHLDCTDKIAVVHNGVITNFHRLREQLIAEGHIFRSETDTEVIAHLIEKYYQGDLRKAVARALEDVTGSYAIATIHEDHKGLVVARKESPLIIAPGDGEILIASDIPAVLEHTDQVMYLEDGDVGLIDEDGVRISHQGLGVIRPQHKIPWTIEEAKRGGYEHFMLKEIHEQPRVMEGIIKDYLSPVEPAIDLGLKGDVDFSDILLLACGTSYHAALLGKYVIEQLAEVPVRTEIASEFSYSEAAVKRTWAIAISQSGETMDTIRALRHAKERGCHTLALTNVVGSSITRLANEILYLRCGPEISVAATKSFTAQLLMLYLLALSHSTMDIRTRHRLIDELQRLPGLVERVLAHCEEIMQPAQYLAAFDNAFFIGRGLNLPIALEGALKLKEISYIHAEGYPAGELKHGPLSLLTPKVPVVGVISKDNAYDVLLANIKEIKARGSPVIAIASEEDTESEKYVDMVIRVPEAPPLFSPIVNVVALQLLAYYTAKERGCPIDMPRNLAKSVTVE